WETVRSQARLYAERRAGTLLEWLWRMTRARYDAMVANGALEEDEPIELLDGLLIVREPEGGRHAVIVGRVRRALEAAFGQGCYVREDKPFALDDMSEPEPDVVVVRGPDSRYIDQHPSKQLLIVEVAESSLNRDRTFKARLYARAGVADYWIVNLVDEVLEVYRRPVKSPRVAPAGSTAASSSSSAAPASRRSRRRARRSASPIFCRNERACRHEARSPPRHPPSL